MPKQDIEWFSKQWGTIADTHKAALGDGWSLANELLAFHVVATDRLSKKVKTDIEKGTLSASDEATLGLLCHGANIFTSVMVDIARGMFDVAYHLVRGLLDIQSFVFACASREDKAQKFLTGELEASECRKLLVRDLESQESSHAQEIDERFKQAKSVADILAHVKVIHTTKVMKTADGVSTPTIWGQVDELEAIELAKGALEYEHWLLSWIKGFKPGVVGEEWVARFNALDTRVRDFMSK